MSINKPIVYAFVPAKGASERVVNKNTRFLNGTRLYIKALETLLQCKYIDKVFLDTESEEMYEMVDYLPINFMKRDIALSTNSTDGHKMFLNEVKCYPDADIYVQLLCTSPFIEAATIDNAILQLMENKSYDSAILMKKDKYYFWDSNEPKYNKLSIPNSKDLPETYTESMGLYICKKEAAMSTNRRYGDNPLMIFGKLHELIDVNTEEDLEFAETYAKGFKQREIAKFNLLKNFISSAALSDVLDDLYIEKGVSCGEVISGFVANFNKTLMGRANTLKLRRLQDNEDFKGIYKALDSYNGVAENDIIIVENELDSYAYFGDLNARLAIRQGASGVIINGVTRDKNSTLELNFPVYSKGYNSRDVRRRATVDYINKPININGITIYPKDLIFADQGAVVVIYKKYEDEVINRVIQTFKVEKSIIEDIVKGVNQKEIVNKNGAF